MAAETTLQHVVSRDGTKIAVERTGAGVPLLLIHGTSSKRGRWAPVLDRLAEGRELVWMDRRGRGDSGDVEPYSIEREIEDVAAVVEHLGNGVDVFGHSYGGICALMATRLTPAIRKLVLYEPPIGVVPADQAAPDEIDRKVAAGDLSGGLEVFLSRILNLPADRIEAMRSGPDWAKRLDVVPTIARELRAVRTFTVAPETVRAVTNKVLLVEGEASPPPFRSTIAFLAANLPSCRVATLPGQQHQAIDTGPDILLEKLQPFLAEGD